MSVTSGFFNSVNGDRKYFSEQMSAIFNGIIQDGIFASIGSTFNVTATTGNTISVGIGRCWFNGTWLLNDSVLPIVLDLPEVLLDRIDAVVITIDRSTDVRAGSIDIIKGSPSSNPVNPTLKKGEYVNQYPLAYIRRVAGATAISQSSIQSMIGTSSTPYVTGILQVTNIDNIVAQWQAQWADWTSREQTDFDTWIASLKDIIDGDVAASLAEQIYRINSVTLVTLYASGWVGSSAPWTQAVNVGNAILDSDAQLVSALMDGATVSAQKAYTKAFGIVSSGTASLGEGTATFKVYKKPVTDIVVGLKGIGANSFEASEGGS